MPLNHYVTLGKSGLRVSPFCLGTMTFGEEWGWGSNAKDSETILDCYLEAGGNFIDTANSYNKGHAEKIIGDYLKKHAAKRDRIVIATKFFTSLFPGDPNAGGASRKAIIAQCEESLRRLQTDYIDLYWLHLYDKFTPIEETMLALDNLVTAGKVRYLGFSDTPAWKVSQAQTMALLRGWSALIAIQIEYSLIQRSVESELIPMARDLALGITPWSPLCSGVLSGKYTRDNWQQQATGRNALVAANLNDKTFSIIDAIIKIANELDTTPARVALAWVQHQPGVSSTIIGARTLMQLNDNLAALEVTLRPEDIKTLNEVSKPTLSFPHHFLENLAGTVSAGGTTINGETYPIWDFSPQNDKERY